MNNGGSDAKRLLLITLVLVAVAVIIALLKAI